MIWQQVNLVCHISERIETRMINRRHSKEPGLILRYPKLTGRRVAGVEKQWNKDLTQSGDNASPLKRTIFED